MAEMGDIFSLMLVLIAVESIEFLIRKVSGLLETEGS
jgi:hypothetical protein